jgi:hypothetical protein
MIRSYNRETVLLGKRVEALGAEALRHGQKGSGIDFTACTESCLQFILGMCQPLFNLLLNIFGLCGLEFHRAEF